MKTTFMLIVAGLILGCGAAFATGTNAPSGAHDSSGIWSPGISYGHTIKDDGEKEGNDSAEGDANEPEHNGGTDAETENDSGETGPEAEHHDGTHEEAGNDNESGGQEVDANGDDANENETDSENDPDDEAVQSALADSIKLDVSEPAPATTGDFDCTGADNYAFLAAGGTTLGVIPEPSTIILLAVGVIGLTGIARMKFAKHSA